MADQKEQYQCEACGTRFHSEDELREHARHCQGMREGRTQSAGGAREE